MSALPLNVNRFLFRVIILCKKYEILKKKNSTFCSWKQQTSSKRNKFCFDHMPFKAGNIPFCTCLL